MTRTLRAFYLGCQFREKLLVVAFLSIAVVLWFSGFSKRVSTFWREQRRTTTELAEQAQWIANSPAIEAAAQKAASRLDASRTLDGVRLVEAVQKAAADSGMRNGRASSPSTPPGNDQFSIHSVDYNVTLNDPDWLKNWETLKSFYRAVQQRSPYIGIEQFTLTPVQSNRAQLNLVMRVSSVEITKSR